MHGSYQSGTNVVDLTDPANPVEARWSDPPPIVPTDIGGAVLLLVQQLHLRDKHHRGPERLPVHGPGDAGNIKLRYLNPQTQEFTIKAKRS